MTTARVVWDDAFTAYDFGAGHPMSPTRLAATARLCRELGLFDLADVEIVVPEVPADDILTAVHAEEYVAAVRRASLDPAQAQVGFGLGTSDDPAFQGMHEVAARIAEGTRMLAEAVWRGEATHGVNVVGGLHHAMPRKASGFCIYNDAAVAIARLLDLGVERIAYVDVDAHHGDGVERMFWSDPRVLTVSVHETGTVLFPGTGFAGDVGGPAAPGCAVNVALPPGVSDAGWLRAVHAVVPPLLRVYSPQILITQHGADSHGQDPLAHLDVSVDAQCLVMQTLHELAHDLCEGRWVALGGGGYDVVRVVPRVFTHLVAVAAHRPLTPDTPVPSRWAASVADEHGVDVPPRMGDDLPRPAETPRAAWGSPEAPYDEDDPVDRAVLTTREAVFTHHGLDPRVS